jgi:hypothetical protein
MAPSQNPLSEANQNSYSAYSACKTLKNEYSYTSVRTKNKTFKTKSCKKGLGRQNRSESGKQKTDLLKTDRRSVFDLLKTHWFRFRSYPSSRPGESSKSNPKSLHLGAWKGVENTDIKHGVCYSEAIMLVCKQKHQYALFLLWSETTLNIGTKCCTKKHSCVTR